MTGVRGRGEQSKIFLLEIAILWLLYKSLFSEVSPGSAFQVAFRH